MEFSMFRRFRTEINRHKIHRFLSVASVTIPILEVFRVSTKFLPFKIKGGAGYPF